MRPSPLFDWAHICCLNGGTLHTIVLLLPQSCLLLVLVICLFGPSQTPLTAASALHKSNLCGCSLSITAGCALSAPAGFLCVVIMQYASCYSGMPLLSISQIPKACLTCGGFCLAAANTQYTSSVSVCACASQRETRGVFLLLLLLLRPLLLGYLLATWVQTF